MSYPNPGWAPPPAAPAGRTGRTRPATVTAAAGLMVTVAVVYLAAIAMSIVALTKVMSATSQEVQQAGGSATTAATTIKVTVGVTLVFELIVTVGLMLLAVGNLRGRNGTRITTFVVSGLFLLCAVCGSIGNAGVAASMTGQGESQTQLTQQLYPSWYIPATIALDIVLTLLYVGIIILLAVPASNRFFKKQPAPVGMPGYGPQNPW
jgi:hypothetical protein